MAWQETIDKCSQVAEYPLSELLMHAPRMFAHQGDGMIGNSGEDLGIGQSFLPDTIFLKILVIQGFGIFSPWRTQWSTLSP